MDWNVTIVPHNHAKHKYLYKERSEYDVRNVHLNTNCGKIWRKTDHRMGLDTQEKAAGN